ncbi:hypothetical protein T11_13705 [Trichinella zimbabwensis]|uniref:Uncharacterized protein n=1 Tax=Trichinella zimbabwensis TaxID=268475 RepID=A0A0V1HQW5_9BILA|nr:hypothetical protein T11_13705 [Trichinella zimbabwensis]
MKQITNGMKPTRDDMRFLVYPDSVMLGWGCFERRTFRNAATCHVSQTNECTVTDDKAPLWRSLFA